MRLVLITTEVAYYNNLRVDTCYLYTELEYPPRTYAAVFRVGTPISPGWRRLLYAMRGRHGCQLTVEAGRPAAVAGSAYHVVFLNIIIHTYQFDVLFTHYTRTGNFLFDFCHATAGSCCSTGSKPLLLAAFMEFYLFFHPLTPRRHIQSVLLASTTLFKFWPSKKPTETGFFENHRFEYCFQVFF